MTERSEATRPEEPDRSGHPVKNRRERSDLRPLRRGACPTNVSERSEGNPVREDCPEMMPERSDGHPLREQGREGLSERSEANPVREDCPEMMSERSDGHPLREQC